MATPEIQTTAADLKAVAFQGLIREDVLSELFNIDPIALPYQDMAGTESSSNPYKSWVTETLAPIDLTNAKSEDAVAGFDADTGVEQRIGNHHQISGKLADVTDRANYVDTIGYSNRMAHELMNKQKELKRDMEAILLSNQASVEMKTTTTAAVGKTAGCAAMIADANSYNGTTGAFSNGIFAAVTPGAATGLTETILRDNAEVCYSAGGNPTILMSTPSMIRKISEYLFTASARVATFMNTAANKQGQYGHQGATAVGSVNVFTSDFATLELVPNQQQQAYDNSGTPCVNVYLFDPRYWAVSYLQGIMAKPLARTGTFERKQLTVDYANMCLAPKSSGVLVGINPALALTAG